METAPTPTRFRTMLIIGGLAFVLGIAAMGWAVSRWAPARNLLVGAPAPGAVQQPRVDEAQGLPVEVAPPTGLAVAPDTSMRVAELEQKLNEIDQDAAIASTYAGRAEAMLIVIAARRAIDRGLGLGYLDAALRQRFGRTQASAVETVTTGARRPVTIEQLHEQLHVLQPQLLGGGEESWWQGVRRGLSGLVVVRQAGAPSPAPAARFERAARYVESGRIEAAIAEVSRMPGSAGAQRWLNDARRYVAMHRALDTLEASAIMAQAPALPPALPPAPAPAAPAQDAPAPARTPLTESF